MPLRDDAAAIAGDMAALRHAIHREPEIGLDLPRTQQKVLAALDGLPLEVATGRDISSVTAVLRGGRPARRGPESRHAVLLRGDMDALPVTETTGLPYASAIDGTMHACGHDLHTAMLAGAARLLCARRDELAGDVIFMFQPGEEGYSGASRMIAEGVLDAAGARPAVAYALHVSATHLPCGVFATRPGPMLAAADVIKVTVRGRGGHASQPHRSADPIPAACEIVTALQALVTRRFDVFDPVVVTVGSFHAGTADNVIPDEARFLATARSYSASSRARLKEATVRLAQEIAAAHGLTAEAEYVEEYPVTVNDAAEAEFARATVAEVFGPGRAVPAEHPLTGAEDFSYVLQQVPGAFISLGACPPDTDPEKAPSNHSAAAVFDDTVLGDGAAFHAELALRRLRDI
jgi:hippurate hydrolase